MSEHNECSLHGVPECQGVFFCCIKSIISRVEKRSSKHEGTCRGKAGALVLLCTESARRQHSKRGKVKEDTRLEEMYCMYETVLGRLNHVTSRGGEKLLEEGSGVARVVETNRACVYVASQG